MKKPTPFNIGGILFLVAAIYLIYYLLLSDSLFSCSIGSVLLKISHRLNRWHVAVAGLLPIYVALMIFGVGVLAVYLGSALQRWLFGRTGNK